ncbi:hypothetical protein DUNSADRAFT_17861 [Dunaliella salina]|uniref:Copper transporter n=1 Tax=Dunaliella salina TaxID=3046 RepID=A0ABQ7G0Z5_DUNSA|nr:hypothetical protein DUNSADRAFT_17861 [Dunaliella salina]|eukprot:KAF5828277.1 hypothetical protein DUNSADRAFT_17861 [Dunaliella salina]
MMRMQCHARSGCLLSNKLSYESTEGVSDMVNQTFIDGCVRVPHLETLQMPLVYSINPFEGVSALYDPSTSDDEVLPRYGVTAASETMSTMNETVNSKTTACVPDPGWTETAQARLTMGSFYFDVLVRRDSFWMYLWGTAGGAYGSFFEVAALLLVLSSLAVKVYQNRLKSTQLMQATQSLRLPIFSPSSKNQEKSPNAVMPG